MSSRAARSVCSGAPRRQRCCCARVLLLLLKSRLLVVCQVFKNLQLFLENKQPGDDLFDRLNVRMSEGQPAEIRRTWASARRTRPLLSRPQTSILNKHLQELMDGLTAKVFRTYNASVTLQQQLRELSCCE